MAVKWDINLGTITTLIIALGGVAIWVNTQITELNVRVAQSEQYRISQTTATDKKFFDLAATLQAVEQASTKQTQAMDNLNYRMGQAESAVSSTNARMDRLADSIISSVEGLKKDVNGVNTQVQLLGQKVDSLDVPRSPIKRGAFALKPLWFEEYTRFPPRRIAVQVGRPSP